jgi:glutathione S-transferase
MEPACWAKISGHDPTDPYGAARYEPWSIACSTAVEHGPYLMGDRFTAVDVMIGSTLIWGREFCRRARLLDAWLARIENRRPAQSMARDGEGRPRRGPVIRPRWPPFDGGVLVEGRVAVAAHRDSRRAGS